MDHGFWTPWCETWFRKRLLMIRSDQAAIYNSRSWSDNLRMSRKGFLFHKNLELASTNWLTEHYKVRVEDM